MNIYKKNIILLAIFISCFVLTLVYGYSFRNFINQPKLPSKYNQYKSIDSGANSKYFEMKQVLNGKMNDLDFEEPIFVNNAIVIHGKSAFSDNQKNIYYKLDTNGNLIDSLVYNDNYEFYFQKGYFIHEDYYHSWALNGDTSKHEYISINYDLKLDSAAMLKQFFKLNGEATVSRFTRYRYHWDEDDPKFGKIDKALFLINDKWYAYYGANLYDYREQEVREPNAIPDQLTGKQILGEPQSNFEIVYFHKTNKQLTNDNWDGQAFINLKIGSDTIKVKCKVEFDVDKKTFTYPGYGDLKLYQPKSNFKLLSSVSKGITKVYVIKPKSK